MRVQEALEIADRDRMPKCASCSDMAPEGELYCHICKSYWDDVACGLFSDELENWGD